MTGRRHSPGSQRGMTLIEIGVALAVAGLMLAVAIPAVSAVTRAQLRQKSGQLAAGVRALYGASAMAGRTCRLVLDLDASAYWSECAKGKVRLAAEQSRGGTRLASREEELAEAPGRDLSDEDRARLEVQRKSAFTPSPDVPKTQLGDSVKFSDVWVQHQQERYTTGRAFLYFWSSGITESASIHLVQGGDVYSILVAPLTGRARVVADRADAPGQPR